MKASEIRELSPEEMRQKANDLYEELFNLRFQHGVGQLENTQKIKSTKRGLARVMTIIKETERKNI
ncbi:MULTISPECIES: 50S ribosomal protein L29 [Desulfococcus]|jgi:large subunit ribosomal protein L29|uniref:Large ribosomal subunit protein uL29 n=1 Tax=Desulfococcus multivorans DSM 2059 TaxID=1121405 RepID=S7T7Y1_DESML|nr:50S ribosomal protein L29 [Desulfococcus multivorans]AOY59747.1 RpmC: 50S ribosomal protein L29 [Desulfococcus multivorans]AQV01921.1 50S ribosomal protein L29 [Desulfococcus multivorans]EPR33232.1 50S ribosomal protein L29 [Desulfococcus multivorans DSM 2059]MDX9817453.1 50S ribosomal protein L29 [Desulfococcus multivorans]SKA23571.1 LSU ribosomal protein L29P [Desulfococcus multivorans DSM 2059]